MATGLLELEVVQSSSRIITTSKPTSIFYRQDALHVYAILNFCILSPFSMFTWVLLSLCSDRSRGLTVKMTFQPANSGSKKHLKVTGCFRKGIKL